MVCDMYMPAFVVSIVAMFFVTINSGYAQDLEKKALDEGTAMAQNNKHDDAIEKFSFVINKNPRNANTFYNRGLSYGIKGELDLAIADFNRGYAYEKKQPGNGYC